MRCSTAQDRVWTALTVSRYFKARERKNTIGVRVRIEGFKLRDTTQSTPKPIPER